MVSSTDESYDPHARMHESFPRSDSGTDKDGQTQMAGDVIEMPRTPFQVIKAAIGQDKNDQTARQGKPVDTSNVKRIY